MEPGLKRAAGRLQIAWAVLIIGTWVGALWVSPMDFDYTSGELLDHTLAWSEGEPLYPELESGTGLRVLNYPPLVPAAVRTSMALGLPPLAGARALSTLALLAALAVVVRWVREVSGCSRMAALAVGGLAATSYPIVYSSGQFHVELPAIALSLAGAYWARNPERRRALIGAGLLMGLACFAKQTQVVPAIAVGLWLVRRDRRAALAFALSVGALGAAGAALLQQEFGSAVWRHLLVYTVGSYSLGNLVRQACLFVGPWLAFAALGALCLRRARIDGDIPLPAWLFVSSSVWLLAAARQGAAHQYFIEWSLVTLVWIGPALLGALVRRGWLRVALVAQILITDVGAVAVVRHHARALASRAVDLEVICARLPAPPERVVIEPPGLARACGARPAHHPFIMTSLATSGLWDARAFEQRLRRGAYPVAVVPFDPERAAAGGLDGVHAERWTPTMVRALNSGYRIAERRGVLRVLEPRADRNRASSN